MGKGESHKRQNVQVLQTQALGPTSIANPEPPANRQNVKLLEYSPGELILKIFNSLFSIGNSNTLLHVF